MTRFSLAAVFLTIAGFTSAQAADQTDVRGLTCGSLLTMSPLMQVAAISEADGFNEGQKAKGAAPSVPSSDADLTAALEMIKGYCADHKKSSLIEVMKGPQ